MSVFFESQGHSLIVRPDVSFTSLHYDDIKLSIEAKLAQVKPKALFLSLEASPSIDSIGLGLIVILLKLSQENEIFIPRNYLFDVEVVEFRYIFAF